MAAKTFKIASGRLPNSAGFSNKIAATLLSNSQGACSREAPKLQTHAWHSRRGFSNIAISAVQKDDAGAKNAL